MRPPEFSVPPAYYWGVCFHLLESTSAGYHICLVLFNARSFGSSRLKIVLVLDKKPSECDDENGDERDSQASCSYDWVSAAIPRYHATWCPWGIKTFMKMRFWWRVALCRDRSGCLEFRL